MGVLGKMYGPIAQSAMNILKGAGGSLWKIASWLERGFVYEASQGANLVRNYPVIDKFVKGVATSIKTLDFNMPSYVKNPKSIFSTLKGYIDKLAEFKGANVGGINTVNQIEKKILNVGVPKGANEQQIKMLQQAVEYGKSLNIEVQIKAVK
jgi:phage-related protein